MMAVNIFSTNAYLIRNKDKLDQKYICPICNNVFRNPVQLDCGHRICQTCIQPQNDLINCSICNSTTIYSEIRLDKGFMRDMQTLEVTCILCDWTNRLSLYQDHLEKSHKQYECEYCKKIFDTSELIEEHKNRSCLKMFINCPLHREGCNEQFLRGDREKHYQSENHQKTILFCFEQISKQVIKQEHISTIPENDMEMETSDASYNATTTTLGLTGKVKNDLKNLYETVDLLSGGVHSIKDELISLNSESQQQSESFEATDKTLSTIKTSIDESNNLLAAMNTNIQILQQDLSTLKQKSNDQQVTSYDGTLVWKINGFAEKMADAKSERQVSIYSPPFRSSTTGYKMCARLYLYGDGNARRTHMSLFFVIMRGPHDPLLVFPFSFKVTFCLFDQSPQQRHIVDSFRPDTKSNSFQRPRSDMNIASGIPKFVSLSIFEKSDNPYVRDDTIFIKVMVDFENLPKTILPYALGLNPGIPTHAQQKLIREEAERRAQQIQSTNQTSTTVGVSESKKK